MPEKQPSKRLKMGSLDVKIWNCVWILIACLALASGCQKMEHADQHASEERHDHGDHDGHDHDAHDGHDHDAHDGHDHGGDAREETVTISAEAMARTAIRVAAVNYGQLQGVLELPAEVQFDPARVAHMSPLVTSKIEEVAVRLGDRVEAGTQLATLKSIELGQARAEYSRAAALLGVAEKNYQRQKKLRGAGISSEKALLSSQVRYEEAQAEKRAARSRLKVFGADGGSGPETTMVSPIAGTIIGQHATRGENVPPTETLFTIADLSSVWVIGRAYEHQIAKIAVGMEATLTLSAYPNRTWQATIDYIAQVMDAKTRSLPIRVVMDNADGILRPGLFGTLRLSPGKRQSRTVLVPASAIQNVGNKTVVFIPTGKEGTFAVHPVTVGRMSSQRVEIVDGLEAGESVVVEGSFILKSELMRAELGHGHVH